MRWRNNGVECGGLTLTLLGILLVLNCWLLWLVYIKAMTFGQAVMTGMVLSVILAGMGLFSLRSGSGRH